ncbi:MAG: DUF86 domain-containing protein [Deferrisomatales bacterium]|nr:DUF86 domain-containing protein [Deferrisomatales bacterium]
MTPSLVSRRVLADRAAIIGECLADLRALPLEDQTAFLADRRNVWAAESCLRRCLEALLDSGRHILAKGFGVGVTEYKEIAARLEETGVLGPAEAQTLRLMAGYRNRLVHFYHEVTKTELWEICALRLVDVERIRRELLRWVEQNPQRMTDGL